MSMNPSQETQYTLQIHPPVSSHAPPPQQPPQQQYQSFPQPPYNGQMMMQDPSMGNYLPYFPYYQHQMIPHMPGQYYASVPHLPQIPQQHPYDLEGQPPANHTSGYIGSPHQQVQYHSYHTNGHNQYQKLPDSIPPSASSASSSSRPKKKFSASSKAYVPSFKSHQDFLNEAQKKQQSQAIQSLQTQPQFPQIQQQHTSSPEVSATRLPTQTNGQKQQDTLTNGNGNGSVSEPEPEKKESNAELLELVANGQHQAAKPQKEIKSEPVEEDSGLKFITSSSEVSPSHLIVPLIIESDNNGFENQEKSDIFITTITNSSSEVDQSASASENAEITSNGGAGLVFMVETSDVDDLTSSPLIFGSSIEEFLEQKKRFSKVDKEEEVDISAEESKQEKAEPVPASPVAPLQWAAIAQIAADKEPKQTLTSFDNKSPLASSGATTSKKEDVKLIPTISNILEPLGSVVLKIMFDKTFQNHYTSTVSRAKIPRIVPRGLVNTGNICFMSSILQLLLYCKPFYHTLNIISNKTMSSLVAESKTPLFESVISLYKYFNIDVSSLSKKKFGDSITPTEFYKSISSNQRFQHLKWGQQEDAEEFFGYLIDGLHEEFILSVSQLKQNEIKNLLDSIISDENRLIIKNELKKYKNDDNNNNTNNNNDNDSNNNNDDHNDKNKKSDIVSDDGWKEVGTKKNSIKRTIEVKTSPITQLFGGSFRSILNVPKQKEQSITLDPFQQIQLDISSNDIKTLEDAFKKISEVEEIPSYKTKNGSEVTAKKQTFIDKLPEILVIHLKRFSFTNNHSALATLHQSEQKEKSPTPSGFGKIEKISKKIAFDHDLKIPEEIISSTTKKFNPNFSNELNYKLIGVVYHIGKNSDGGHYTVDVLHENNQWLSIDDTLITELKLENVLDGNGHDESIKTAYILMYQKV